MKCGRERCKICIRGLDNKVEYLWRQGYSLREIEKEFNFRISRMTIKRHIDAVENEIIVDVDKMKIKV
ncbi:hypothetical protein DRO97_02495 [Archaeoglobales archaeon]|nr:MAG: hypothetical protein DRO97_02495 [Archaeoglobales archaeon]